MDYKTALTDNLLGKKQYKSISTYTSVTPSSLHLEDAIITLVTNTLMDDAWDSYNLCKDWNSSHDDFFTFFKLSCFSLQVFDKIILSNKPFITQYVGMSVSLT